MRNMLAGMLSLVLRERLGKELANHCNVSVKNELNNNIMKDYR